MPHGGARTPSKPAAVSGPGALSKRTDGRPQMVRDLPDAQYGEGAAFKEIQQGADMATAPGPTGPPQGGSPGIDLSGLAGMGAPTEQPNTPVTDGAALGAGAGTDALGLDMDLTKQDSEQLRRYLPVLIRQAQRDDAPASLRKYVRTLIAQL